MGVVGRGHGVPVHPTLPPLQAIRADGMALEYAAHELKEVFDLVLPAVVGNGEAINFASHDLQFHPKVGLPF